MAQSLASILVHFVFFIKNSQTKIIEEFPPGAAACITELFRHHDSPVLAMSLHNNNLSFSKLRIHRLVRKIQALEPLDRHPEDCYALGISASRRSTMRLTVHIQDRLGREIKLLAENQRQSVSSLTAEALSLYMQTKRRRELGQKVLALAGRTVVDKEAAAELEQWRGDPHDRA